MVWTKKSNIKCCYCLKSKTKKVASRISPIEWNTWMNKRWIWVYYEENIWVNAMSPQSWWHFKSIASQICCEISDIADEKWWPQNKTIRNSHCRHYSFTQFFHSLANFLIKFFWFIIFYSCKTTKELSKSTKETLNRFQENLLFSTKISKFSINSKKFLIFQKMTMKIAQLIKLHDVE